MTNKAYYPKFTFLAFFGSHFHGVQLFYDFFFLNMHVIKKVDKIRWFQNLQIFRKQA